MSRISLKPLVKLTKEQWEALIKRTMEKQTGKGIEKQAAENIMGFFEPPVERRIGALHRNIPIEAEPGVPSGETIPSIVRLPIEEARAKYFANPELYTPGTGAPEVRRLRMVPPGSPEELARGVAYERIKQEPIVPSRIAQTRSTISKTLESEAVTPEAVKLAESVNLQLQAALVADQLWRDMGGGRSMGAKVWEMYRKSSRQAPHIHSARDYFVSSFVRWRNDPAKFERAYPREAKVLKQLWSEFEQSLTPATGGK